MNLFTEQKQTHRYRKKASWKLLEPWGSLISFFFPFGFFSFKYSSFIMFCWLSGKESSCNEGHTGDSGSIPGSG